MNRADITKYIKKKYKVTPDYPFSKEYADTAVFRHQDTRKWFALCMNIRGDKLGLVDDEFVDAVTLKSEPMLIDGLVSRDGFHRAYHMNKKQWMTVELGNIVSEKELKNLIDLSFEMTDKKKNTEILKEFEY